ncbi:RbsD/FucU family protein [Thermogemmatispora sp.]|uniref:RbsD/FucU family protein n=1 Tax=Thermogemmatispora sp. TaxID=1968838 RepID=UPI0035E4495D
MLSYRLLHPAILESLASAGHGSRVLIADGNYPLATRTAPRARLVYLNLRPGLVSVTAVLETLLTAIPVEAAHVMLPDDGSEPEILSEFRALLPHCELQGVGRFAFYDLACSSDVALAIATGEQRLWANILLTIGVVPPPTREAPR